MEIKYFRLNLIYSTADIYSRSWLYTRYGGNRIHESVLSKIFVDFINLNDIVLDIGAHLGYFSCLAGKLVQEGKVLAFDTDCKSCQRVEDNARPNKLNNITIIHAAVSNLAGTVKLIIQKILILDLL